MPLPIDGVEPNFLCSIGITAASFLSSLFSSQRSAETNDVSVSSSPSSMFASNPSLTALVISGLCLLPRTVCRKMYDKLSTTAHILSEAKLKALLNFGNFLKCKKATSVEGKVSEEVKGTVRKSPQEAMNKEKSSFTSKQLREQMDTASVMLENKLIKEIGSPVGIAVSTVLVDMFGNDFEKAQSKLGELSQLLGAAVRESLDEVSYVDSELFSKTFETSFKQTYKAILRVKKERCDMQKGLACSERKEECSYSQIGFDSRYMESDVEVLPGSIKCMPLYKAECLTSGFCRFESTYENELGLKDAGQRSNLESSHSRDFDQIHDDCKSQNNKCVASDFTDIGSLHPIVNMEDIIDQRTEYCVPCPSSSGKSHTACHSENVENLHSQITEANIITSEGYGENSDEHSWKAIPEDKVGQEIEENNICTEVLEHKDKSDIQESSHSRASNTNLQHADESKKRQESPLPTISNAVVTVLSNKENVKDNHFQESIIDLFDRSVKEYERRNKFKYLELMQNKYTLLLGTQQLKAQLESNKLMQEKILLNRSKASFKENAFVDQKLNKGYMDLSRACADELLGGMILMLVSLGYGVWHCSHALLLEAFASCQFSKESQKSKWFSNPMDTITNGFRVLLCHFKVFSNVIAGIFVLLTVVYLLTRYTVTSSSQAMPASITLVVLGGLCGWAGKFSVDSLGGSGFHWLLYWEALCTLHFFACCFTPYLFYLLNGSKSRSTGGSFIPYWARKCVFHTIIISLPVMAGLAPFASLSDWVSHFYGLFVEHILKPLNEALQDRFKQNFTTHL